jgi:beta-phosphoglucomutase-like phosphatase (HAD superfamily)
MCEYPEAIFFDFDGVIIDSVPIKKEAFRKLFKGFGQDLAPPLLNPFMCAT